MQRTTLITFLAALVCGAVSQQVVPTGCDYPVQQNFNLSGYIGKWYEIEATNHIEEIGGICMEANYDLMSNGSVEVDNRQIMQLTGEWATMVGYANPRDENSTEARFVVNFPSVNAYGAPYWVLDSDYSNYSLILSCRPYGNGNSIQTMWFLARERNPSLSIRNYVRSKITELMLDAYLEMKTTIHDERCDAN